MIDYINVFFFFQAEDGIRDKLVTGVQTCALPIFTGWPIATMLRGRFVVRGGKLVGSKSDGRHVSRGKPCRLRTTVMVGVWFGDAVRPRSDHRMRPAATAARDIGASFAFDRTAFEPARRLRASGIRN